MCKVTLLPSRSVINSCQCKVTFLPAKPVINGCQCLVVTHLPFRSVIHFCTTELIPLPSYPGLYITLPVSLLCVNNQPCYHRPVPGGQAVSTGLPLHEVPPIQDEVRLHLQNVAAAAHGRWIREAVHEVGDWQGKGFLPLLLQLPPPPPPPPHKGKGSYLPPLPSIIKTSTCLSCFIGWKTVLRWTFLHWTIGSLSFSPVLICVCSIARTGC